MDELKYNTQLYGAHKKLILPLGVQALRLKGCNEILCADGGKAGTAAHTIWKSPINNLTLYFNELEKQQARPRLSRRKEII